MKTLKDPAARREWALARPRCQCCGHDFSEWVRGRTVHHIAKPGRADVPANWLCLCVTCHQAAELLQVIHDGRRVTKLPLALCLALKRRADPDEYDPEILTRLYGQRLPDVADISEELEREWRARR